MFSTIVGAGAACRCGSDQKMRLLAAPAPQHCRKQCSRRGAFIPDLKFLFCFIPDLTFCAIILSSAIIMFSTENTIFGDVPVQSFSVADPVVFLIKQAIKNSQIISVLRIRDDIPDPAKFHSGSGSPILL
jgi:hypothetical protein